MPSGLFSPGNNVDAAPPPRPPARIAPGFTKVLQKMLSAEADWARQTVRHAARARVRARVATCRQ
jgi:hypothetical protein